jgi:hypothetical protein
MHVLDLACYQEGSAMIEQPRDDASEDYGYDLAHEVPVGPDRHVARSPRPQSADRAPHVVDPDTDYESDEAHDL